jgi:hypothetical protein
MFSRMILAAALLGMVTPAQAAWHEAKSKHFVVYSDDNPKQLQSLASKLEQFDVAVRALRKMDDPPISPSARLTVFVVRDIAEVRRLHGGGRSSNVAGFYIPRSSGSIAIVPEVADLGMDSFNALTVFFHEYAHHLMYEQMSQTVPRWFSEGFAEFFSTAKFERDGSILIGVSPAHRSFGVFTNAGISYSQLLTGEYDQKLDGSEAESLYGRGWLLAHYLTFAPARQGQLSNYMSRLARGEKAPAAAAAAFGDLKKLESDVSRYISNSRLDAKRVKSDAATLGQITVRQLTPGEAEMMPIRIRSKVGVDQKTAPDVLTRARRVAQAFPKDELVAVSHSEASLDARDHATAIAAATLAIELNPQSVEARLMRGRALLARAAAGPSKAADLNAARADFIAANRIEPEHPEPLRAYYESFVRAGQAPNKGAISGLHYAAVLAPADRSLRWLSAQQYLIDGDRENGRATLAPLAFDPHGGRLAAEAGKVVDLIDSGKGREALDVLRKGNTQSAGPVGEE